MLCTSVALARNRQRDSHWLAGNIPWRGRCLLTKNQQMASVARESLKICIGVASVRNDKLGIGPMLFNALSNDGHDVRLVEDGDAAAYRCDLLLLTGSARPFVKYPQVLRGCRQGGRPITALWLFEPLPSPSLNGRVEQLGMRLASCDLYRLARPYRGLLDLLPFHGTVRKAVRSMYAARFTREMSRLGVGDCSPLMPYDLYGVMCEYRWFREYYSEKWCDYVFASTLPRCQFLRSKGITATFVPMGYHPDWGHGLGLKRDINVLFIGHLDKTSRPNALRTVQKDLASRGIELMVVAEGCYGKERTRLLNRARIVLDLPRLPWEMPLIRLLMCMGCGALVVSNWTGDPAPFARKHLVQAPTEQLAEAIVRHLESEDRRRSIVTSAFEFVTQELTLERSLMTIRNTVSSRVTVSGDS
jgi:hypothetical protein